MSFNRRGGGDRRPDRPDRPDRDRYDRPQRRDWQPRERPEGDRPFRPAGGDRPYQPRGGGGGGRPYPSRPREDRAPDEGAMSIRLDPRRVSTLKQLAADAGVRPGDLVRQWVEERVDAARGGSALPAGGGAGLTDRISDLAARVEALEAAVGRTLPAAVPERDGDAVAQPTGAEDEPSAAEPQVERGAEQVATGSTHPKRQRRNAVTAAPAGGRVALHDEMIEVLREHGPLTAAELAGAIAERGRYAPPRSGKALDAAMVSQRVSNPTYRSRFVRKDGRIGLAE